MMSTKSTKHYLLWFVCFLTLLLVNGACKRDEAQPEPEATPVPAGNERLLIASTHFPGIKGIEYNADGTPKRYEINPSDVVDILYSPDSIIYISNRENEKVMAGRKVYKLENGLVKSTTAYLINNKGESSENYTITYIYKEGKVQKEVASQNGLTFAYAEYIYDNANENLITMSEFDKDGRPVSKATYEYTNILDKSEYFTLSVPNMDSKLFPKKAIYLAKKCISEDYINKAKTTTTFTYELDSEGYVIVGKRIIDGAGSGYSWTNTWQ